ncbi:MAG TPA: ThuA domain-containing protein [Polyangia bacterium]|nr:ThuA domain-containing protein [Polyangia bacterium]
MSKRARPLVLGFALFLANAACGGGGSGSPGGGGSTGSAGTGQPATGGNPGSGGGAATGGQPGGTGGDTAPASTGGTTGSGGATATGGTTGGGGTGGATSAGGSGGVAATGGASGGAGGAASGGAGGATASHGNKVLIYTKATGFVHDSTPTAAAQITKSLMAFGITAETSEDETKFTTAGLAPYASIVLLATTGEPFGTPGTMQIQALVDWVHAGGGLVAIENADHAYDDVATYVNLIGGDFNGHSAGTDTCVVDGTHPTTMHLPATFMVTDEIYYTTKFNTANVVVLRCGSDKRPISWVRQEGAGRVFYTALGHNTVEWTEASPPLVDGHVVPGILWSMGRTVP